ncbi:hypothetical protein VE25_04285 [Devosia geojensis]|uniref:Uncharacterized protein n=1 Tax=Devosia geojensis TaxID=443610 RepID=A0A0F5FXS5_9HYPH|nr:hypothetical protein [Devosia geojensis]KKB12987.1 hypothetical protein VE25_04285 [Devosia geojensis]
MIPAPYDFKDIDRNVGIHPSVAAEIAAARERDGVQAAPTRMQVFKGLLRRMILVRRPRQDWSHVPAE